MRELFNKSNQLFAAFTLGFSAGWLAHLSRAQLLLEGWHNFLQVISLLGFAYCAFTLWFRMRPAIPSLPMTNFKVIGLLCVTVLMFIANSAYMFQYTSLLLGLVVKDLIPITCIFCAPALGIFTIRQRKIFFYVFCVFLGIAVSTIAVIDVSIVVAAADRNIAYEEVGAKALYSYQVAIGMSAAMLLLYYLSTVRSPLMSLVLSFGMLFWLYTSLIYSKRQSLGEFLIVATVLSLLLIFGKDRTIRKLRVYLLLGLGALFAGTALYAYQSDAFWVMLQRLEQRFLAFQESGVENFDRFVESSAYLKESSSFRLIIGRGVGGVSYEAFSLTSLHVGWVNLILKGGVYLPLFYLVAMLWNIFYVFRRPQFPGRIVSLFFSAYLLFQLFYSPVWGYLPSLIFLGMSFFAPEIFLASARVNAGEAQAQGAVSAGRPYPIHRRPGMRYGRL